MPAYSRSIISRTDPRIQGGTTQVGVAPPPVDPMPMNRKQPVGPPVAAGPGGVAGGRGPLAGRGAAPMGIKRMPSLINREQRRGVSPPWLRRPVPTGALIGG